MNCENCRAFRNLTEEFFCDFGCCWSRILDCSGCGQMSFEDYRNDKCPDQTPVSNRTGNWLD